MEFVLVILMKNLTNNSYDEISILKHLMEIPSTSFYEASVSNYIQSFLDSLGLKFQCDQFGNIICRYTNGNIKNTSPIALIAHMDHPGIELIERLNGHPDRFLGTALGGVPFAIFNQPFPVLIINNRGERIPAISSPLKDSQTSRNDGKSDLLIQTEGSSNFTTPVQVIFDVPEFHSTDEIILGRALDDLAGCSAILSTMKHLVSNQKNANVFAVFTRAEEIGLIGARLLAKNKTIPIDSVIISIEASPIIPGVSQGDGPIIRTGDALTTFDSAAEIILSEAAKNLQKEDKSFVFQRHLMSGGGCEATAFAQEGYKVTGIALPLANWHNATSDLRDSKGDIGAEQISKFDYLNAIKLIKRASTIQNHEKIEINSKLPDVSPQIIKRLANQ